MALDRPSHLPAGRYEGRGPSPGWMAVGAALMIAGIGGLAFVFLMGSR